MKAVIRSANDVMWWRNLYFITSLPIIFALIFFAYLLLLYPGLSMQGQVSSLTLLVLSIACAFLFLSRLALQNYFKKDVRIFYEKVTLGVLFVSSLIAILTTIGIIFSLIFETISFFKQIPISSFLFGLEWSPQSAFHYEDKEAGVDFKFGALPIIYGTLLITFIAVSMSVFIGLFAAIFLSEYASKRQRAILKPILEILAGIPTVVYGFFAALTIAPFIKSFGEALGLPASSESALAAGLVMGVMLIPFISSLTDDVFHSIPQALRDASSAMGATNSETILFVLLPAAMPGIVGAVLLALSRAIGETMIVVMAAGLAANITVNPFESVTTVTAQIVSLLVGDQEFDSPRTLAAFALGLLLFLITLCLNIIALKVRRKFTRNYE